MNCVMCMGEIYSLFQVTDLKMCPCRINVVFSVNPHPKWKHDYMVSRFRFLYTEEQLLEQLGGRMFDVQND